MRKRKLPKNHLNQYKSGKAYQYFQSEWLKEIFYTLLTRPPHTASSVRNAPPHRVCVQSHTKCGYALPKTREKSSLPSARAQQGTHYILDIFDDTT